MRLLILGGTVFLGRAVTDAALAGGHHVHHLNRGVSSPPDPRVNTLHADRNDVAALVAAVEGLEWDAVIDTSGYLPQAVAKSVAALSARTGSYCFISSISAYAGFPPDGYDETAPLAAAPDPLPEAMTPPTYGPLKAACEAVVAKGFGARALVIRPGLIVGPRDPTDRFTWWTARMALGGTVLAPGRPGRQVQFIDVRDLADWIIAMLERGATGTFNATGPERPLSMEHLLAASRTVAESDAAIEWVDDAFLVANSVVPWKEMPLWIPESDPSLHGFMGASIARARAAGLRFRGLDVTLQATLEWARSRPADHAWKAGLPREREAEVLRMWKERT